MALLNTVETYMQLQPFKNVEELNKNTIEIRKQYADQMTLSTKKVLDVLHRYAVKYPGVCYLSKNKIAEMVGISRRTVIRACNQLEELGVIVQHELKRHNGDRRQSSNAIVFNTIKEEVKADEINNVTPECHTQDTLAKTPKSNNTLDTGKADFEKKESVKNSVVNNQQALENVKRGMRDKMPAYLYDTLSPYFSMDDLYLVYGALIRGKAYVDKAIQFESYEDMFKDAVMSVINGYKRGVVKNIFAVMYAAARDTTAQIYRKMHYNANTLFAQYLRGELDNNATYNSLGVAGMGIGLSMGLPAGMIAGAVISGAYFGDKMSPLSDTTNLAAGLTGTDLFEHIKHMFWTTIPGLAIALGVFTYLGNRYATESVEVASIAKTSEVLQESFVISPLLLLVPLVVIVLVAFKVPAIPALIVGIVLGFLSQVIIQGGNIESAVSALQTGFVIDTGNQMVDELFNRGGLDSMMYTVSMTIVAMTFGGILEFSGMLQAIMNQILKVVKSAKSLIISTLAACFMTNATCSEQYISIVVPSRMFSSAYRKMGLHSKNLSRSLEDGGTLTSVFIPWNTCGVFIFGTLGVSVVEYGPYAILNLAVPFIGIFFALTGISIVKLTPKEMEVAEQEEETEQLEVETVQ